jgi:ligand-binding sensor domain-containing protein/serine phosphatase RsbU (regulator of sigma subunit)
MQVGVREPLFACFLLGSLSLAAHPADRRFQTALVFEHISIERGLSQSIVEGIAQDQKGFMWFITEDGINRFDGYNFRIFKHNSNDPGSLSHNELKAICIDHLGSIWVGTFYQGLERFDRETERFTHFRHDPGNPRSLGSDIVRTIVEDRNGELWVGTTGGGLNRLDRTSGEFIHYRHDPGDPFTLSNDDVRATAVDATGALWVGTTGGGLNRLDTASGRFTRYLHDLGNPRSLSSDDVRAILQDRRGNLWVGTYGGGLDRLDQESATFTHYRHDPRNPLSLGSDSVLCITEDSTGTLWVGTDGGGLNRFDEQTGTFIRYLNDPNNRTSLSSNRVYSLFEDQSSVLWIGTYGEGLNKADLKKKNFLHFMSNPNARNSLNIDIVWSFWEDRPGNLWIGTNDGGLNRLDPARNSFISYRHHPANPNSLSHDSVRMVIQDRSGALWLATNGGGLDRFDPATGRFSHFRHNPEDPGSLSFDELRTVYEDRSGTIWVGTYGGGLDRLDSGTGRFAHFRHDPANPHSISNNYVRVICEDESGVMWIGTHGGGLNAFDRGTGVFTRYQNDPRNPRSLSNDYVFAIHPDKKGNLWLATYGGGLNKLDRTTGTFTQIRRSDGLPDDAVYGILEDNAGNLWISTNSGLCRYNPASGTFRNYTVEDGLQSNEFNGGAYYKSSKGEMFFGGVRGFNAFMPDQIRDNPFVPPVVITDFRLFNKVVPIGNYEGQRGILAKSITFSPSIVLSHRDQIISFEFSALHYASPVKNQYAYRMEGLSDDWIELGTRRFVMFTTLPSGKYVFRVRGSNSDGVWNQEGTSLAITVRPPWWSTRWAFGLYALLTGCVFTAILLFVREREREKALIREAELRAAAAEIQSKLVATEAEAIQAENIRKTEELEDARRLQLSMLPESLPDHPDYEIAVCMRTASEVGGDYYDFGLSEDGALTVAVGDATGHGTRAGIMVAIMKGLFSTIGGDSDPTHFFVQCNRILRKMNLENMMMAMTLVHLRGGWAKASTAAMPPVFIFRSASGQVETVSVGGMFLGAPIDLSYEEKAFQLSPGDVLLLMTDGLAELLNAKEETLDYPRVVQCFEKAATLPPNAIIDSLLDRGDEWRGNQPQNDDITLVVIRMKPSPDSSGT